MRPTLIAAAALALLAAGASASANSQPLETGGISITRGGGNTNTAAARNSFAGQSIATVGGLARNGGRVTTLGGDNRNLARGTGSMAFQDATTVGGTAIGRGAQSFVAGTAQPILTLPYGKDELGEALGVSSCAIAAIVDVRLAQAFVKTLGEPEKYASLLQELDVRVQRVEKRRAEEKAHRNNVRHGRK